MSIISPHKKLITSSFVERRRRELFGVKLWWYWQTLYQVEEDVTVRTFDGVEITIEKGFITDYATIPWPFRWIFSQSREYNLAATAHDKLFVAQIGNRLYADINFLCWMYLDRVPKWTMLLFFNIVVLGSKKQWDKYSLKP